MSKKYRGTNRLVGGVVTKDEVRVANSREARVGAGTPVQAKKQV